MTKSEINTLLDEQILCRIAFNGEDYPYLAPFRYVSRDNTLYFHFTDYGKKMKLLRRDDKVCVQVESYKPDLSAYNFVSLRGRLTQVTDPTEKKEVIDLFRETGKERLSPKFLAAHGFDHEKGWDEFRDDEGLVIVKLVDVAERVGLRSP